MRRLENVFEIVDKAIGNTFRIIKNATSSIFYASDSIPSSTLKNGYMKEFSVTVPMNSPVFFGSVCRKWLF